MVAIFAPVIIAWDVPDRVMKLGYLIKDLNGIELDLEIIIYRKK